MQSHIKLQETLQTKQWTLKPTVHKFTTKHIFQSLSALQPIHCTLIKVGVQTKPCTPKLIPLIALVTDPPFILIDTILFKITKCDSIMEKNVDLNFACSSGRRLINHNHRIRTPFRLHRSRVCEGQVKAELCESQNWVYGQHYTHKVFWEEFVVLKRECSLGKFTMIESNIPTTKVAGLWR